MFPLSESARLFAQNECYPEISYTSTGVINCNYHIEKARNVKYCNNASALALNGFHFYGDDLNTNWAVNDIGAHARGLYIQDIPNASNGKIGLQTRRGNMWEADDNNYGEYAAKCDASDFTQSLFIVEEENDNSIFPQKILPQEDWFVFLEGGLDHCGLGVGAFVSDFEYLFAEGNANTGDYKDAELWEIKRMLLRTLMDNPSEADDDGVLESYLSHEWSSTAAKFARVERRIADYSFANAATVTHLESAYTQFDSLREDIDALSETSAGSSLSDKLADMALVTDTISVLLDSLEQSEQIHLQQMLDTIAAISVTQYYEQAWKTLKTYEVKINMGQTPASAGLDDLEDIAYGDQEALGAAVRHAWYHLPGCERYGLIVPDEGSEERAKAENKQDLKTSFLRIEPNPAFQSILISTNLTGTGAWAIVGTGGTVLSTGNWAGDKQLRVDVQHLAPGMYFFLLIPDRGEPIPAKISVIH
ncbi:MAG: hypothetical protein KA165_13825 [Saprospiraceae bacterium]|nr:hypothetical protein [Saprospiraceae bacterium]